MHAPAPSVLRIATRRSLLARRQAGLVADLLGEAHPGLRTDLVCVSTRGDRHGGRLAKAGGKGLFTADIETLLRRGEADVAVHSAKDMPAVMAEDLVIAAVPGRGDPSDALVSRAGGGVEALPSGAVVGTGSPRRRAELLAARRDLNVVAIRGNVDTRVRKVSDEDAELDAVVLATSGLERSGLLAELGDRATPLDVEWFVPAAGQAALVVQCLAADEATRRVCGPIDHPESSQALRAERDVVRDLGADCHSCLAVHVRPAADGWDALAMVARPDGSGMVRRAASAPTARDAAGAILDALRAAGAESLLRER